jgi:SET domain-containing protein
MNKWVLFKGLGAKINHSCEPTCGIQCDEDGYHKYVAFTHIKTGQELTYDYAMGNYTV